LLIGKGAGHVVARGRREEDRAVHPHAEAEAPPGDLQVEAIEPLAVVVVHLLRDGGERVVAVVEAVVQDRRVGYVDEQRIAADALDLDGARGRRCARKQKDGKRGGGEAAGSVAHAPLFTMEGLGTDAPPPGADPRLTGWRCSRLRSRSPGCPRTSRWG